VLFALLVLRCNLVSIIVLIVGLVTSTSRCLSAMLKRTPSTSDVALKPGAGLGGDYITSERVCFRNSQKQWMFSICFLNSLLIQCPPVQYQCLFLRPGTVGTASICQGYTQYKLTLKSLAVPVSCNYCSAQFKFSSAGTFMCPHRAGLSNKFSCDSVFYRAACIADAV